VNDFGLIAVKASVDELIENFDSFWDWKTIKIERDIECEGSFLTWMLLNEKSASHEDWSELNNDLELFGLWQDQEWVVVYDREKIIVDARIILSEISKVFGETLSFNIDNIFSFMFYDEGEQKRWIFSYEDKFEQKGNPLPQEKGIFDDNIYKGKIELLIRSFGLSNIGEMPLMNSLTCLAVEDKYDYSQQFEC
jgi:hypothetical protein